MKPQSTTMTSSTTAMTGYAAYQAANGAASSRGAVSGISSSNGTELKSRNFSFYDDQKGVKKEENRRPEPPRMVPSTATALVYIANNDFARFIEEKNLQKEHNVGKYYLPDATKSYETVQNAGNKVRGNTTHFLV